MKATVIAVAVMMASGAASATSKDCGCTKTPTAYDKTQDVKISDNTSAIGDVKLTAGQAFDIAVEGRATAGNALTTVYGLTPQVNNNAKGIADLQESKVDKSVFTADQQRQDKALSDAVSKQAVTDSKQTSDLKSYADAKATSAYQTSVAYTDATFARADADRAKGDAALQAQIAGNLESQVERDAVQDDHINAAQSSAQTANERASNLEVRADASESAIRDTQEAAQIANYRAGNLEVRADASESAIRETNAQVESDRQQSIDRDAVNAGAITAESQARAQENVKLAAGISAAQSTGDYAVSRSDAALRNAATNAQAIRNTNAKVAEHSRTLANHEQRLGELERNTSSRFADIDKRIDENKRSANAGIAGVAAMLNIPQVTGGARFSAGVGVGQRGSEQAVAVGFSSQLTDSVIGKVSVAGDSQQQWTVGAGLAVQW